MKNELEPWEVGLSEQVQGHEFNFDESAFAHFEQLYAAEAGVAGGQTTVTKGTAATQVSTGTVASLSTGALLKLLLLAGASLAIVVALVFYVVPNDPGLPTEEGFPGSVPESAPKPNPAGSHLPPEKPAVNSVNLPTVPKGPRGEAARSATLPEQLQGSHTPNLPPAAAPEPNEETTRVVIPTPRLSSRKMNAVTQIPTSQLQSVQSINSRRIKYPAIKVRPSTPSRSVRDRNTLFPDIIDN